MRLQLALNVEKLDQAIDFYSKLFDTKPHKLRPGYANFEIKSPPLKLVLFENPTAKERLNHLGVEVFNSREIDKTQSRLRKNGMLDASETNTLCCHAVQDKIWSKEPQGLRWEWYRITEDNPNETQPHTFCGSQAENQPNCCN